MIDKELRGLLKPKFCIYKHDMSCDICSVRGCGIESIIRKIKALVVESWKEEEKTMERIMSVYFLSASPGEKSYEIHRDIIKAIIAEMKEKWG